MVNDGKSTKRRKFHDKDKYYKLAKEQGLRSRAAFKLSQINRQYPVLQKCSTILDLCAAPGGWSQVAARTCPQNTQIIAVDILPIRRFPGHRNITTIVGDITTDRCKADIRRAVSEFSGVQRKNAKSPDNGIDLVLHDGAPNIGAAYEKDAYEQTELSVHALRCATQHLREHGTFITKIYRSRDYASFHWVLNQLFGKVNVLKPKASRTQSAEIFIICQDYYKPDKIDPKMLDPKYIFEVVEGDTTIASASSTNNATATWNVFHKNWGKSKRHRDGYDTEHFDAFMRHIETASSFVEANGMKEAIRIMSVSTGLSFHCSHCVEQRKKPNKRATTQCNCKFYLNHPLTTAEIKENLTDLKVLNKNDFKSLLTWREKMTLAIESSQRLKSRNDDKDSADESDSDGDSNDDDDDSDDDNEEAGSEDEEDAVQSEISELRKRKQRERKRLKKKERKKAAKRRRQAALGMDLNAIDVQKHDQFFSLASMMSKGDLEAVSEVNIDRVNDDEVFGPEDASDESDGENGGKGGAARDDDTGYSHRLDRELDAAYERYLSSTKNGLAKSGTKHAKRSKRLQREKLAEESQEDYEMLLKSNAGISKDTEAYVRLLQGSREDDSDDNDDDDDDGDEDSDDGFASKPMTPNEHAKVKASSKARTVSAKDASATNKSANPLIHKGDEEAATAKTARWFSNPLFAKIGSQAQAAAEANEMEAEEEDEEEATTPKKRKGDKSRADGVAANGRGKSRKEEAPSSGLNAEEVLAMMPKTDKQVRHEKRLKALARDERRQKRKARKLGELEGDFEMAPGESNGASDDEENERRRREDEQLEGLSEAKKKKILEARELIKAGLGGGNAGDDGLKANKIEMVAQEAPLPIHDDRRYDSENEEYDSDDYARTLAMGTMMLRHSKAKQLVDASYNRYAWNDPHDLPEWFVDDENKHYRPQLPIPQALMEKMKQKQRELAARPIAKVAEARARKNKRARLKLAAAKKKAEAVANSSEMSETMKLKAISKALRSEDTQRPGKTYVVAKKGSANRGGKGMQVVDKRMKSDKRSMQRALKKRKHGKQGGLTGSKKRRNHK